MKRDHIIINKLQHAERYFNMHPAFEKAFEFLRQDGLAELPAEKYQIDGDRLFCMISKGPDRCCIAAGQQDHKLVGLKSLGCCLVSRPPRKPALREPLLAQLETLPIIDQNLDRLTALVVEDENASAERITTKHLATNAG